MSVTSVLIVNAEAKRQGRGANASTLSPLMVRQRQTLRRILGIAQEEGRDSFTPRKMTPPSCYCEDSAAISLPRSPSEIASALSCLARTGWSIVLSEAKNPWHSPRQCFEAFLSPKLFDIFKIMLLNALS